MDELQDASDIDHRSAAELNDDVRVELRQSIDAIATDPEMGAATPRRGDLGDGGQDGSLV